MLSLLPMIWKNAIFDCGLATTTDAWGNAMGSICLPGTSSISMKHRTGLILGTLLILAMAAVGGIWWCNVIAARYTAQTVRTALYEGHLDEASAVLDRWLKNQPQVAEAHYLKARLAWARNDLPLIHMELAKAPPLGYQAQPLAGLRGLLLAQTNQFTEAEPLLREAADNMEKLDPDIAKALVHVYLAGFRLGRAADLLHRWKRDWPGHAQPYFLQAQIDTLNQASAQLIIAHCQEALERDPTLDEARLRLADLLRLNHRNIEAAAEYATYVRRKPNDPLGHLGAGQNALDIGNPAESSYHLDQALKLTPQDPVILGARAAVETRLGHLDAAQNTSIRLSKLIPLTTAIAISECLS